MMAKTKSVPLRVPENLLELAKIWSKEIRADQSTVLRQWLYKGAEEVVMKLIEEERITIGRAAELLDVAHQDIYRIAHARGVELGATVEQYLEGKKNLQSL
jgi:predicted HTH domain antitoxin